MTKKRKRIGLVGGAVLGFLGLAVLLGGVGTGARRSVTLSGGSRLILRGVTTGTIHHEPPKLRTLVLSELPNRVRSALRLPRGTVPMTAEPTLILWTSEPIGGRPPPAALIRFGLVDESGFEVLLAGYRLSTINPRFDQPRQPATLACITPLYPRQSRRLRIRVYELSGAGRLRLAGECAVSLPGDGRSVGPARPRPPLPPAPAGGEEFLLRDFAFRRTHPIVSESSLQMDVRFDVKGANGRPAFWRVGEIRLCDTSTLGNQVRIGDFPEGDFTFQRVQPDDGLRYRFPWPLWPRGAAALRVEFVRTPEAPFAPDEVLEVKAVPVPSPDAVSLIRSATNLLGIPVEVIALVGEHATLRGREHDVFGQTTLEVDVPPLADDMRFDVVEVIDDRGRPARQVMASGNLSFGFQIEPGARTVDIRVAISKRRIVEYLVKPTWPPAG